MTFPFKSAVVIATAAAIALTCVDLRPAAAEWSGASATVAQAVSHDEITDMSARKKRYRRGGDAAALAAFGMIAGTIAGIAAAERRRDYYERNSYYGYYGAPAYGYGQAYGAPVYQRRYHRPHYAPQYHGGYRGPHGIPRGQMGTGGNSDGGAAGMTPGH